MNNFEFENETEDNIIDKLLDDPGFKAIVSSIAEKAIDFEGLCDGKLNKIDFSNFEELVKATLASKTSKNTLCLYKITRITSNLEEQVKSETLKTNLIKALSSSISSELDNRLSVRETTEKEYVVEGFIPLAEDRLKTYVVSKIGDINNRRLVLTESHTSAEDSRLKVIFTHALEPHISGYEVSFSRGIYKNYLKRYKL